MTAPLIRLLMVQAARTSVQANLANTEKRWPASGLYRPRWGGQ